MYNTPKIFIEDKLTLQIYLCFLLDKLGDLMEDQLSEIVTETNTAGGLEYLEALSLNQEKEMIKSEETKKGTVLSLLPRGLTMSREFYHRIPCSIRDKSVEYGKYLLKMADMERSVICRILRDDFNGPCYLTVRFLNEIKGNELMNLKIYAPDYEQAKQMRERFYERPTDIVTNIMNMFIKDSYL